MEKGHNIDAPALMRRKRKVARQQREKTPEPSKTVTHKVSDEESSSTTADQNIQTVKMQIRPPGSISAHKSKILNRRNKTFGGAAIRSSSAPRECELEGNMTKEVETGLEANNGDAPELMHLMRYARRSLSSPRHKYESSESGKSSPSAGYQIAPPPPPSRIQRPVGLQSADEERLSRLERNLQRFEQERRKFEIEKLLFEREKREMHRMRYKQVGREDRRRLVESYKKFKNQTNFPSESDETHIRLSQSFKEARRPSPMRREVNKKSTDYESSTMSSLGDSSDDIAFQADSDEEDLIINHHEPTPIPPPSPSLPPPVPERKSKSLSRHSSSNSLQKPMAEISQEPSSETVRERKKPEIIENAMQVNESPYPSLEKEEKIQQKKNFISKLFSVFTKKTKSQTTIINDKLPPIDTLSSEKYKENERIFSVAFLRLAIKESRVEWSRFKTDYPQEVIKIQRLWCTCLTHTIILALFCGFGGLIFRFIEGSWENSYKCEIRKVKRDFIDQLWLSSHNQREDDWKSLARNKLRQFEEELQTAFEIGITSYSGIKSWSFVNSVMFCLTVVTSIGYGHIAPKTTLGRGITIIYAIIGIPMFLILLADFGKLFTRMIKFVWAYVRRVYYTGTCRKVRKQQQVRDVMRGMYTVYDYAIRRPSTYIIGDVESGNTGEQQSPTRQQEQQQQQQQLQQLQHQQQQQKTPETPQSLIAPAQSINSGGTPTTPYPETFEIDDEFNLPISVATTILLIYIFAGASVYVLWEDWSYFEAFYFVFISMSTIGFGDFVPNHPIFMMCSIIYLIFGLALTSMFINVVQIKLSDSFKHASAKIGATIGLVTQGDNSPNPNTPINESEPNTFKIDNNSEPIISGIENEPQENHKLTTTNNDQKNYQINHNNTNHENQKPPPPPPRAPINQHPANNNEHKTKRRFF